MTETAPRRSRILVGVDGSAQSIAALRFALAEARLRDAALVAVMSVEIPDYAWIDPYGPTEDRRQHTLAAGEDRLRTSIIEAGAGDIEVEQVVTETPAPAALVDRSRDADLLVVGSRGHGGFRGLMLGSVSMQCVLHAHCPVTVLRPEPSQ